MPSFLPDANLASVTTTPPLDPAVRSEASSLGARIAASADGWKRKLLDLTKRNRALNFKPTKVSTVTIVDEQPAEVFRQLYMRERTMRFKAAPESSMATAEAPEDAAPLSAEFAPYDPATLGERHTDEFLQTTSQPEALDKSLRRLDEQARQSIEEQGVNTLFLALGMLEYREAKASDITFRAPIVLLPVELTRKSARSGYSVKATDDDPIVNPALVEYLKRDFALTLPELPESTAMPDDYDLQNLLAEVVALIEAAGKTREGWSVKADVYLGLFSFQKFAMYKDLEANEESLKTHRLIRQLVSRASDDPMHVVGLPDDVRQMELDRDFSPERTAQVVDADSSQLRAIAASAKGYDLVIEGPPGTGKSQTITNLIAQALASGKSVLFVAEKMAALQVVYERLQRAKLGEFCLELHSTKANKRAVMRELAATLDASLQGVAAPTVSTQRLPAVRTMLSEYVEAVHAPHGTLGTSPYYGYGQLARALTAPRVTYSGPLDQGVSRELLDQTTRELADLAATSTDVGVPAEHPWRDTSKSFYSEDALVTIRETALALIDANAQLTEKAQAFFAAYDPPRDEMTSLIARGQEVTELAERVGKSFTDDVLEQAHAADIAYVEEKSRGLLSFLAVLDGRYRAIKSRWTHYRRPGYSASLAEQAHEMKVVDRLRVAREALAALDSRARELFGALWRGEGSEWPSLMEYVGWVVELRAACVWRGIVGKAIDGAARTKGPDPRDVAALREVATRQRETLERLRGLVGWPADYLDAAPLTELSERARLLSDNVRLAPKWAAFESARAVVSRGLARELLPAVMSGDLAFKDLVPAFLRAFWMGWLSAVVQSRPALAQFHTLTHEQRVREFRELDQRVLLENRAALVGALRDRVQQALRSPDAASELPYLRREMAKQRMLAPLRRSMRQAGTAIRAIKPCFMMSPLTVAQLLQGGAPSFDIVIFDEASQLPPEDAVGAIMRGARLVVVGDPKQLPPTDFFSVTSGLVNEAVDDDGEPLVQDAESILEEFMGAGVPMSRLKWHYRSAHESLINFSNVSFYESDLYTFPSVETGTQQHGLQFEYLANGVYEGKGLNAVEARRVADEVVAFAREALANGRRSEVEGRRKSLGVGTFNLRQQLAILDELEQRRRDDPSIEPFFDRSLPEPFFVKNLENIQGDERDVIFISVTYGRGVDGRIRFNFGPLNGENGWRRLNVLTTRARQRMKVFSSMRGEDINAAASTSRGAHLLREFLVYAERGHLESVSASLAADAESPFERDLIAELTARGVKVVPQVGVAGYRIDLAVLDDALPGRFLCGIECDGVAYHASETARDRDRLRQQVLEARGWIIHRVWSTDWFKDRAGQIDRLLRLIDDARDKASVEAKAQIEAAQEAAQRETPRDAIPTHIDSPEASPPSKYVRPVAEPYVVTPGEGRYEGKEILDAPHGALVEAVALVARTEGPVHEHDLFARVAAMWGTRSGSRIQARIRDVADGMVARGELLRRGPFLWSVSGECVVRSRAGTRIPGERIAPEEYRAAVELVLGSGHAFPRAQLITEARAVLGFSRTSAALEEGVTGAVDALVAEGLLGEGSAGVRRREG